MTSKVWEEAPTSITVDSIPTVLEQRLRFQPNKNHLLKLESKLDLMQTTVTGAGGSTRAETENIELKSKVANLEGCSRWQNICIVGLPESVEGGARPTEFFFVFLTEVFGDQVLSCYQNFMLLSSKAIN